MGRNKQERGETERNRKKQEKQEEKKKQKKTRWNKKKQNKTNKNIHLPNMQHNTTKIFQLIYTIHSFFTPYCDKKIFIKILW